MKNNSRPWTFLDEFRGVDFSGRYPTVAQVFHITSKRYPGRLCWSQSEGGISLTYQEAERKVAGLAKHLKEMGFGPGNNIAVTGKNSVAWGICFMAVLYCGATVVPMDNAYSGEELVNLLTFGDVCCVLGDSERLAQISVPDLPVMDFKDVMDYDFSSAPVDSESDSVAAILFTSGTTGNPKGVMLTNENLVSCCYNAQALMNIYETDVFYAVLPIHHAYTLQAVFLESLSVGAHLVFGQKMSFARIVSDMKQFHVTMFLAVPMVFNKMSSSLVDGVKKKGRGTYASFRILLSVSGFCRKVLRVNPFRKKFAPILDKLALKDIRICISGGGPLKESTTKMFHQLGVDFVQGYGMTETSPITHLDPVWAYIPTSVGKPTPCVEQKIVDPDKNSNGLIYVRGPVVMKGYYKNQKATDEILDSEGWLNTGDIGHLDKNGYLYLTGRAKNVIVTEGGKNVFPEEIEADFEAYEELEQVCIIPYEMEKGSKNEGLKLLVLPGEKLRNSPTCSSEIERIVTEVNRKLLPYKRISKTVVLTRPLETTSSRKVKRLVAIRQYSAS